MNKSIDRVPPVRRRTRREALGVFGAGTLVLGVAPSPVFGQGDDETVLTEALVLRDPDIPAAGNLDGDITIVEYFDYQCPYCRKLEPELRQVVQDDGKVRLVGVRALRGGAGIPQRGGVGANECRHVPAGAGADPNDRSGSRE